LDRTDTGSGTPLVRSLTLRDLVLFNIAAVIGIRWLAAAAHAGPGSIALWILAAVCFFVPSGIVVAGLSRQFPEEGGFYIWTRKAFGEWHGFLAAWCYWMNNLFYFPSLVIAGAGMAAAIFGPSYAGLADNRTYVLVVSLTAIWAVTLANVTGLDVGKWIGNVGGASTYVTGALLVIVGVVAWMGSGSATRLDLMPTLDWEKFNFWPQIAFAFGGLELAALMGGEIRDTERSVRKAAWISGLAIAAYYVAGTLALLVLLPASEISVVTGLTQAAAAGGKQLGVTWLPVVIGLLVIAGVAGQLGAWMSGSARLPLVLGVDRYLPTSFADVHPRFGTPHRALLFQAVAASFFLLILQAGETLRAGYQLLVDMAVITYFIPFLYLFAAAWRFGYRISAASGAAVTALAIALSLVPPAGVHSLWLFEAKLVGGSMLLVFAARLWFRHRLRFRQ
jgi:amino acid transporter